MGKIPLRVASVGECTMDFYPHLRQEFVGGISLNFAVNCKRAGAELVSLVSCAGQDYSTRILSKLAQEGIDASHVKIQPAATARQEIIVQSNGERIFPTGGYQAGVLADFRLDSSDIRFVQGHNILCAPLFQQIEPLFRQLMTIPFEGWRIADFLDLADFERDLTVMEKFSKTLDIAFVSGNHEMAKELQKVSRFIDCIIVVTLGAGGSMALEGGESICEPAVEVARVVDSTGCGDAFQAAFAVSYWQTLDLRRALQNGSLQAARVLQHYGGTDTPVRL